MYLVWRGSCGVKLIQLNENLFGTTNWVFSTSALLFSCHKCFYCNSSVVVGPLYHHMYSMLTIVVVSSSNVLITNSLFVISSSNDFNISKHNSIVVDSLEFFHMRISFWKLEMFTPPTWEHCQSERTDNNEDFYPHFHPLIQRHKPSKDG